MDPALVTTVTDLQRQVHELQSVICHLKGQPATASAAREAAIEAALASAAETPSPDGQQTFGHDKVAATAIALEASHVQSDAVTAMPSDHLHLHTVQHSVQQHSQEVSADLGASMKIAAPDDAPPRPVMIARSKSEEELLALYRERRARSKGSAHFPIDDLQLQRVDQEPLPAESLPGNSMFMDSGVQTFVHLEQQVLREEAQELEQHRCLQAHEQQQFQQQPQQEQRPVVEQVALAPQQPTHSPQLSAPSQVYNQHHPHSHVRAQQPQQPHSARERGEGSGRQQSRSRSPSTGRQQKQARTPQRQSSGGACLSARGGGHGGACAAGSAQPAQGGCGGSSRRVRSNPRSARGAPQQGNAGNGSQPLQAPSPCSRGSMLDSPSQVVPAPVWQAVCNRFASLAMLTGKSQEANAPVVEYPGLPLRDLAEQVRARLLSRCGVLEIASVQVALGMGIYSERQVDDYIIMALDETLDIDTASGASGLSKIAMAPESSLQRALPRVRLSAAQFEDAIINILQVKVSRRSVKRLFRLLSGAGGGCGGFADLTALDDIETRVVELSGAASIRRSKSAAQTLTTGAPAPAGPGLGGSCNASVPTSGVGAGAAAVAAAAAGAIGSLSPRPRPMELEVPEHLEATFEAPSSAHMRLQSQYHRTSLNALTRSHDTLTPKAQQQPQLVASAHAGVGSIGCSGGRSINRPSAISSQSVTPSGSTTPVHKAGPGLRAISGGSRDASPSPQPLLRATMLENRHSLSTSHGSAGPPKRRLTPHFASSKDDPGETSSMHSLLAFAAEVKSRHNGEQYSTGGDSSENEPQREPSAACATPPAPLLHPEGNALPPPPNLRAIVSQHQAPQQVQPLYSPLSAPPPLQHGLQPNGSRLSMCSSAQLSPLAAAQMPANLEEAPIVEDSPEATSDEVSIGAVRRRSTASSGGTVGTAMTSVEGMRRPQQLSGRASAGHLQPSPLQPSQPQPSPSPLVQAHPAHALQAPTAQHVCASPPAISSVTVATAADVAGAAAAAAAAAVGAARARAHQAHRSAQEAVGMAPHQAKASAVRRSPSAKGSTSAPMPPKGAALHPCGPWPWPAAVNSQTPPAPRLSVRSNSAGAAASAPRPSPTGSPAPSGGTVAANSAAAATSSPRSANTVGTPMPPAAAGISAAQAAAWHSPRQAALMAQGLFWGYHSAEASAVPASMAGQVGAAGSANNVATVAAVAAAAAAARVQEMRPSRAHSAGAVGRQRHQQQQQPQQHKQ